MVGGKQLDVVNERATFYLPTYVLTFFTKVDRGCHFISAKSFDKMCGQMKAIKTDGGDDMHSDMVPHNSRTTTETSITTDIPMPVGVNKGR